jgi:membrane-associated protease RseP (regulator of RpoE activity)
MTFKVQLGDRKNSFAHDFGPKSKDFHFEMPTMPVMPEFDMPVSVVVVHSSVRSGLMIENLTPQLGDFFGAKNGEGVLVRSVERGSRAEKAGFRAGDVIVKVNGETVHDAGDFSHALRARKDSNTASVNVLRDKKEQTLTLQLPDRKQSELNSEIDFPDLKAESLEIGQLTSEWAHLGPEMEEAINRDLSDLKPQIEQYQKEWQLHEKDLQKQMREMQREWQKHGVEIHKKLRLEHHADI